MSERERESVCVCVCVVSERERERECVCLCVCMTHASILIPFEDGKRAGLKVYNIIAGHDALSTLLVT